SRLAGAQVEHELAGCKSAIEARIQQPVETFAYPYGDLNTAVSSTAKRMFRAACTTQLRRARDEPMALLPRIDMYYVRSTDQIRSLLMGTWDAYLALRRWGRALRRRRW